MYSPLASDGRNMLSSSVNQNTVKEEEEERRSRRFRRQSDGLECIDEKHKTQHDESRVAAHTNEPIFLQQQQQQQQQESSNTKTQALLTYPQHKDKNPDQESSSRVDADTTDGDPFCRTESPEKHVTFRRNQSRSAPPAVGGDANIAAEIAATAAAASSGISDDGRNLSLVSKTRQGRAMGVGAIPSTTRACGERPVWAQPDLSPVSWDYQRQGSSSSLPTGHYQQDERNQLRHIDPLRDDPLFGSDSESEEEKSNGSTMMASVIRRSQADLANKRYRWDMGKARRWRSLRPNNTVLWCVAGILAIAGIILVVMIPLSILGVKEGDPLDGDGVNGDDVVGSADGSNSNNHSNSNTSIDQNGCPVGDQALLDVATQCRCQGYVSMDLSEAQEESYLVLRTTISAKLQHESLLSNTETDLVTYWDMTNCLDVRNVLLWEMISRNITDLDWYGIRVVLSDLGIPVPPIDSDHCVLEGISCSPQHGGITTIGAKQIVQGVISPEVGLLTNLERLYAVPSCTGLTNTIPTEIGLLVNLKWLKIARCSMEGTLPSEIGLLESLVQLDFDGNYFSGTIPPEITKLTKLETLNTVLNAFTGTIPSDIGRLDSLETLLVQGNRLTGYIPSQIELLTSLSNLRLSDNAFSDDTIPSFLWTLRELTTLDVNNLQLGGTIPWVGLANMSKLEDFFCSWNKISGTLSAEIGRLGEMQHLEFGSNRLSGTIPSSIGLMTKLTLLDLRDNKLHGTFPSELSMLSDLNSVNFRGNDLVGDLEGLCEFYEPGKIYVVDRSASSEITCSCCSFD